MKNNFTNNQSMNEDEIDLRELFITIWNKKIFIIIFTFIVTSIAFLYILLKNPNPIYEGKIYFEMGEMKGETFGSKLIENTNDLAMLINITFDENIIDNKNSNLENPSAKLSKGTTKILEIKYEDEDRELIKNELNKIKEFILARHEGISKLYNIAINTKQIGEMKISKEAINKPKKDLNSNCCICNRVYIINIFSIFYAIYK